MKLLKKIFGIRTHKETLYTGKGYTQGIGFNVTTSVQEAFGFKWITSISIDTDSEWIRNLKKRWHEDDVQQEREKI